MTHLKFPSLEQFDSIHARETYGDTRRSQVYRAKIKLHGTNAGIRVSANGTACVQSRTQDLDLDQDIDGLAAWFAPQAALWARAAICQTLIFFGEWAGPGIKKGDAIQLTDKKRFFIFALGVGEAPHHQDPERTTPAWIITDPAAIEAALPDGIDRDQIRVLPWEDEEPMVFDFADETRLAATLEMLNESVEAVAERDPYVSRVFGIKKNGEGFVLVPVSSEPGQLSCERYARRAFKAKTEKHRVRKQARAASAIEPLPETATALVETFCTPARVEQAIDEACGGDADIRLTGKVIGWVTADIAKEAGPEIAALEAAGTPFIRLKGEIANATRLIFLSRLNMAWRA